MKQGDTHSNASRARTSATQAAHRARKRFRAMWSEAEPCPHAYDVAPPLMTHGDEPGKVMCRRCWNDGCLVRQLHPPQVCDLCHGEAEPGVPTETVVVQNEDFTAQAWLRTCLVCARAYARSVEQSYERKLR
jgi:hypothetical protein